jgi:hypothetical protein
VGVAVCDSEIFQFHQQHFTISRHASPHSGLASGKLQKVSAQLEMSKPASQTAATDSPKSSINTPAG